MRQAITIAVVSTLLIATVLDVVAAGVKTVTARSHLYYAIPSNSIAVAVPSTMKNFPTEMLPQ